MQTEFEPIDLEPQSTKNRKITVAVIVVLLVIILAVVCALLVKFYVVSSFIVDGVSMYPTLDGGNGAIDDNDRTNGDVIYLNKVAKIKRGDIVVFTPDNGIFSDKSLVKRVIAVTGDRVQIIDNIVYLNGQMLDEPYINEPMRDNDDVDVIVGDGYIFCMGDNRNHSTDSRAFGVVPLDVVVGKCFLIKTVKGKLIWV
ncbi:MAG: signal peptidase I [Bacteroides sp.]|nr:signal peptidase I [Bacillota bacterium]MCM1394118.1 signal peptidase I [[Eubacterium] siraeum]MCM1455929.1 signal peptidase I [Bacteroides sp.]